MSENWYTPPAQLHPSVIKKKWYSKIFWGSKNMLKLVFAQHWKKPSKKKIPTERSKNKVDWPMSRALVECIEWVKNWQWQTHRMMNWQSDEVTVMSFQIDELTVTNWQWRTGRVTNWQCDELTMWCTDRKMNWQWQTDNKRVMNWQSDKLTEEGRDGVMNWQWVTDKLTVWSTNTVMYWQKD